MGASRPCRRRSCRVVAPVPRACPCRSPTPRACPPPWPYRGLAGHCIAIQSSFALLSCHNTVRLYCDTNNPLLCNTAPLSLQYKPVYCNTLPTQPSSLQYKNCIAIQFFITHSTCNTLHIAIQNSPNLQYNHFLAIQLGSSPFQIFAPIFFSL